MFLNSFGNNSSIRNLFYIMDQQCKFITAETGDDCVPITKEDALKDAWGNPFTYSLENNGRSYRIKSFGADGKDGGTGVDFDVFGTGP